LNDPELFKKLDGEIWEFRTFYNKTHFRLFAFWDNFKKDYTFVVCTHGIIKKSRKTPPSEIKKAESLRKQYLKQNYGK
jgi:phage-related protein